MERIQQHMTRKLSVPSFGKSGLFTRVKGRTGTTFLGLGCPSDLLTPATATVCRGHHKSAARMRLVVRSLGKIERTLQSDNSQLRQYPAQRPELSTSRVLHIDRHNDLSSCSSSKRADRLDIDLPEHRRSQRRMRLHAQPPSRHRPRATGVYQYRRTLEHYVLPGPRIRWSHCHERTHNSSWNYDISMDRIVVLCNYSAFAVTSIASSSSIDVSHANARIFRI